MIYFSNIYEYCCSPDKNGLGYVNRLTITNIYFWIHYANVETTENVWRINIFFPRVFVLVTSSAWHVKLHQNENLNSFVLHSQSTIQPLNFYSASLNFVFVNYFDLNSIKITFFIDSSIFLYLHLLERNYSFFMFAYISH